MKEKFNKKEYVKQYGELCPYLRQPISINDNRLYGKCALTDIHCERIIGTDLECLISRGLKK